MNRKIDPKLLGLVGIFFLVFGFFTISIALDSGPFQIRATKQPLVDVSQSLLLAFPLTLKPGESATVNCVARAADGASVADASCTVSSSCGSVSPALAQTNVNGISAFSLNSPAECIAQLTATINNTPIQKTVSVQFTP